MQTGTKNARFAHFVCVFAHFGGIDNEGAMARALNQTDAIRLCGEATCTIVAPIATNPLGLNARCGKRRKQAVAVKARPDRRCAESIDEFGTKRSPVPILSPRFNSISRRSLQHLRHLLFCRSVATTLSFDSSRNTDNQHSATAWLIAKVVVRVISLMRCHLRRVLPDVGTVNGTDSPPAVRVLRSNIHRVRKLKNVLLRSHSIANR